MAWALIARVAVIGKVWRHLGARKHVAGALWATLVLALLIGLLAERGRRPQQRRPGASQPESGGSLSSPDVVKQEASSGARVLAVARDAAGAAETAPVRSRAGRASPLPETRQPDALTPLDSSGAMRSLASAWSELTGKRLGARGLAILIAHWALETGRGRRMMANNFGGLKGEYLGASVELVTRERVGKRYLEARENFRGYPSTEQGAKDYILLLKRRYPRAFLAVRHGEVEDFVAALERGGYFTDDVGVYARAMRSLWFEYLSNGVAAAAYAEAS